MLAVVPSACLLGVTGYAVAVEVHVTEGLPGFTVVGLPDASCREARDRVRAAIQSSKLKFPMKRVTVNLAPTGVRKVGAGFDLAIAVALLVASGQLEPDAIEGLGFVGELGLDGSVRPVVGALPMCEVMPGPATGGRVRVAGRGAVGSSREPGRVEPAASARRTGELGRVVRTRRSGRDHRSRRRRSTWPKWWVSRSPARRSRSPPRAVTTC